MHAFFATFSDREAVPALRRHFFFEQFVLNLVLIYGAFRLTRECWTSSRRESESRRESYFSPIQAAEEALMVMIQFIDARTGETMTEIGSREWPAVPRVGDQLVFTSPVRKCKVVSASWIDLLQHHGKLIARLGLEDMDC